MFSESNTRFVLEVRPEHAAALTDVIRSAVRIGTVSAEPSLGVYGINGELHVNERIADLKRAWQSPLKWE